MKWDTPKIFAATLFVIVLGAIGVATVPNPGHPAQQTGGETDAERTFWGTFLERFTFPGLLDIHNNLSVNGSTFFVDASNSRVGIGTTNPQVSLHLNKTDAIIIPVGNTAQRPNTTLPGQMRYNDQTKAFEGYNGIAWGSIGGAVFVGKTANNYNGNIINGSLTGYDAGNAICNKEFEGSHMCVQAEIINTVYASNISAITDWTGTAWINAGGAKYAPADIPVNDCNGWRHGTAGTYLGNFWIFEKPNGGVGAVVNCGSLKPLSCCR